MAKQNVQIKRRVVFALLLCREPGRPDLFFSLGLRTPKLPVLFSHLAVTISVHAGLPATSVSVECFSHRCPHSQQLAPHEWPVVEESPRSKWPEDPNAPLTLRDEKYPPTSWLATKESRNTSGCKTLSPKYIGSYRVKPRIKVTYRLDMPHHSQISPTFHVSHFKPTIPSPLNAHATSNISPAPLEINRQPTSLTASLIQDIQPASWSIWWSGWLWSRIAVLRPSQGDSCFIYVPRISCTAPGQGWSSPRRSPQEVVSSWSELLGGFCHAFTAICHVLHFPAVSASFKYGHWDSNTQHWTALSHSRSPEYWVIAPVLRL